MRNARTELQAQFDRDYGWAKNLNPEVAAAGVQLVRELQANPRAFAERLVKELGMSAPPAATAPKPFEIPKPDLRSQDGKVEAYSAEAMRAIVEGAIATLREEMDGKVKPMSSFVEEETRARQVASVRAEAQKTAETILEDARKRPHFAEHEAEIQQRLMAMDPQLRAQMGAAGALFRCYTEVLQDKVFPTITQSAEAQVRRENERKLAASSGTVHPASGAPGTSQKPVLRNAADLAAHMEKLAASMTT